jgi:hypothetical protein
MGHWYLFWPLACTCYRTYLSLLALKGYVYEGNKNFSFLFCRYYMPTKDEKIYLKL